jgi:hypothetical protein
MFVWNGGAPTPCDLRFHGDGRFPQSSFKFDAREVNRNRRESLVREAIGVVKKRSATGWKNEAVKHFVVEGE